MVSTLITHLQLFGIGFSFGIAGPCFFYCAPILITYIAGRSQALGRTFIEVLVFLIGRLTAYLILGAVAGFSGALIRDAIGSPFGRALAPLGGAVSIGLGVYVILNREEGRCGCERSRARIYGFGSLFALGLLIGISPCAPLVALLVEIALMAHGSIDGALYAFSFGMGTLIAGLVVIGALAGIAKGITARVVRSRAGTTVFRVLCGGLLIAFGISMVIKGYLVR